MLNAPVRVDKTVNTTVIRTFFDFFECNLIKSVLILYGGAGSGKSVSICQNLLRKIFEERNKRFLIVRKTLPSLRITTYQMMLDLLDEWEVPYNLNRTEMTLRAGNNNMVWFRSLDEPEKVKSLNVNYIYIEEATELSFEDYMQLRLRVRRTNDLQNQIFMSFNPVDEFSWPIAKLVKPALKEFYGTDDLDTIRRTTALDTRGLFEKFNAGTTSGLAVHHSTYQDNRFLPDAQVSYIEDLVNTDENFYRVYTLGEFGHMENIIYNNYVVEDIPDDRLFYEEVWWGLDFGYNNPSALIEIGIRDQELYVRERLYQSKLTNPELIAKLDGVVPRTDHIYADSAEPARIQEMMTAGYTVFPAEKNIKDGIDFVKTHKLHVDRNSVNLIKELNSYHWKQDKDKNVVDEPVRVQDHLCDACRYAIYTHLRGRGSGKLLLIEDFWGDGIKKRCDTLGLGVPVI